MGSVEEKEEEEPAQDMPLWVQWVLALMAFGIGAWFGWVMF